AALVILRADAEVLRIRHGHALRLIRQADRPLLDHAVDVVPPRVAIQQAVDRQSQLLIQTAQEPAHPARRLARALSPNAIMLLPESILIKTAPNRIFFDV